MTPNDAYPMMTFVSITRQGSKLSGDEIQWSDLLIYGLPFRVVIQVEPWVRTLASIESPEKYIEKFPQNPINPQQVGNI